MRETGPAAVADALVGDAAPRRHPAGEVVVAEISADSAGTLADAAAALRERRRDAEPCLVGVPVDADAVPAVARAFDKTVLVADENRDRIRDLLPFLPALYRGAGANLAGVGSARTFSIDVSGCAPDEGVLGPDVRARRGRPLHDDAGLPDVFAFAAPPAYRDVTYSALSEMAPVSYQFDRPGDRIEVVGFETGGAGRGRAAETGAEPTSRRPHGRVETSR